MKRFVIVGATVILAVLSGPAPAQQKKTETGGKSADRDAALAKARRTQGDIRVIATALEAYAIDFNMYPPSGDLEKLEGELAPTYLKALPRTDAWGNPYRVEVSAKRLTYRVTSAGSDGVFEKRPPLADPAPGATLSSPEPGPGKGPGDDPGTDLVFEGGFFVRWWKGLPTPPGSEPLVPATPAK